MRDANEEPRTTPHDASSGAASDADDRAYLDELFDRALEALALGDSVSVRAFVGERPELEERIAEVVAQAEEVALLRPDRRPSVPGFRIERELGRGGMGIVYLAHQESVDREVALKLLPSAALLSERARQRFLSEARSLGRLRHPHVVTVHEVIEQEGFCAFALEYVDGTSLDGGLERLAERADFAAAICRIGAQIARALEAVHAHGLVHRDVKPSNILLRQDGTALLADFGLVRVEDGAHVTRTGEFVGTRAFAAPEQLRGDHRLVDARTDLYALGATLYRALAGEPPYAGATVEEQLRLAGRGVLRPLARRDVSRDLVAVLETCLAPEPERRYASARELAEDLERVLALRPVRARRASPLLRASRLVRRNARTIAAASLSAVVALALTVFLALHAWDARTLPERVDEGLRQAHLALLEPHHAQRVQHEQAGFRSTNYELHQQVAQALEHYEHVLSLDPDHAQARHESELVRLAVVLGGGESWEPSTELRVSYPGTVRAFEALRGSSDELTVEELHDLADADRRAVGLLAFLVGSLDLCQAAWNGLDLRSGAQADPLIDAANGQRLHELGDSVAALPRLLRSFDRFPEAGFLAMAIADCACGVGEVEAAEYYLRFAMREPRDPWKREIRVRADVLAARGRDAEARAAYEEHLLGGGAPSTRRRFAAFLADRGKAEEAIEVLTFMAFAGEAVPRDHEALAAIAVERWAGLPREERVRVVQQGLARPSRSWAARAAITSADAGRGALFGPSVDRLLVQNMRERWLQGAAPDRLALHAMAAVEEDARGGGGPTGQAEPWTAGANPGGTGAEASAPRWRRIATEGAPVLLGMAVGFDRVRGEVVLFGGRAPGTYAALDETWTLRDGRWIQARSPQAPPPRYGAALLWDESLEALLLVGGESVLTAPEDLWAWSDERWRALGARVPGAARATEYVGAPTPGRLLSMGGVAGGKMQGETRVFDGRDWSTVPSLGGPGAPSTRWAQGLVLDETRDEVLLFGGGDGLRVLGDTWIWDGERWQEWRGSTPPPPRTAPGLAYDPARGRVVLHGGSYQGAPLADTWEWDGRTWRETTRGRPPIGPCELVFDGVRGQVLLFDGRELWAYEPPGAEEDGVRAGGHPAATR